MTIKECYEKVGSDYDGVLKRLGSEALVKRFAVKFLNDPSFQELTDGLAAQDGEKAFRAAHTLKGNIINLRLDITHLYYPAKNSFQKGRLKRREIFTELLLYTLTT